MKLLALMVYQVDGMYVEENVRELRYNNGLDAIPLSLFGNLFETDYTLKLDYEITSTFEETNGKFNIIFGNSAIIDCKWVFPMFLEAILAKLEDIPVADQDRRDEIMKVLNEIVDYFTTNLITFCSFAVDVEGVLKNQSDYYIDSYNEIVRGLEVPATELVKGLTLKTNQTLSTPLVS